MTHRRYTKAERNDLATRAKTGDVRARNGLLDAMRGLVVIVARNGQRYSGLEYEDLEAEAWAAVFRCVDRFDPDRPGSDFGGMCGYELRTSVEEYCRINMGSTTRDQGRRTRLAARKIRAFVSEAERNGMSVNQAMREAARHFNIGEMEAASIFESMNKTSVGQFPEQREFEPIADDAAGEGAAQESSAQRAMASLLSGLSDEERLMIQERIFQGESLDAMSSRRGVSREKIRRQWNDILAALRAEAARRGVCLTDFLS